MTHPAPQDQGGTARKVLWLHIGHGKTGTTALQHYCHARSLVDPTLHYPKLGLSRGLSHVDQFMAARRPGPKSGRPSNMLGSIANRLMGRRQPGHLGQILAEIRSQPPGTHSVLSAEQLVFFKPRDIADLLARLKGFDLRIVYYIRRQEDLLESVFRWQQVARPGWITDIDDLLARQQGSFDFEERLKPWRRHLPDSAFRLRLYHAETCARDIVSDFSAVLGLPPFEGVPAQRRERPSLDPALTRVLMAYDALHPKGAGRTRFLETLQSVQRDVGRPRGTPFLSDARRAEVTAMFDASNRRIATAFLSEREAALLLAPSQPLGAA